MVPKALTFGYFFAMTLHQHIETTFGHKLRLRVSGISITEKGILLVKHHSIGKKGILWAPPGGGLDYAETVEETLRREFLEETGLEIEPKQLVLVNEYFEHPLHAVELFFVVNVMGGELKQGFDPELGMNHQIIQEVKYVSFDEITTSDPDIFHSMFQEYKSEHDFRGFKGFHQNIMSRG
jgi:8-oxo-dGTP diphosphatase